MIAVRALLRPVLLGLFMLGVTPVRGDVVFVAPNYLTSPGSMQITEDITFTVTKRDSTLCYLVFQNLVQTNDGTTALVVVSPSLALDIWGGPAYLLDTLFAGNSTPAFGDITETDGYLTFGNGDYGVSTGDTVTLVAGTYALGDFNGAVNPQVTQTFTGNMFLADNDGKMISDAVAVPEPSTWGLAGAGLLGVVAVCVRGARRQAV